MGRISQSGGVTAAHFSQMLPPRCLFVSVSSGASNWQQCVFCSIKHSRSIREISPPTTKVDSRLYVWVTCADSYKLAPSVPEPPHAPL